VPTIFCFVIRYLSADENTNSHCACLDCGKSPSNELLRLYKKNYKAFSTEMGLVMVQIITEKIPPATPRVLGPNPKWPPLYKGQ